MAEPADRKTWRPPRERSRPAGAFGRIEKTAREQAQALRLLPWYRNITRVPDCFYCCRPTPPRLRTRDHIIALSNGGLTEPSNLVMACESCNKAKAEHGLVGLLELRVRRDLHSEVIADLCAHAGIDEEHLRFLTR